MATHSSISSGKKSCTEELGGLQSMGSQRVRHDYIHVVVLRVYTSTLDTHVLPMVSFLSGLTCMHAPSPPFLLTNSFFKFWVEWNIIKMQALK